MDVEVNLLQCQPPPCQFPEGCGVLSSDSRMPGQERTGVFSDLKVVEIL